ncbi:MAG: hypothetical protein OSB41_08650 [Kiritimatiellae bacterium]|nr:hypothetical protein [Kiritimatiellia bacterium]
MPEIVFERQTGRLLEAGNAQAWTDAIAEVNRKALLAEQWGDAGFDWLRAHVSVAAWNRAFDAVVKRALPQKEQA